MKEFSKKEYEIWKKSVGKTFEGKRISNIEVRKDGDIWLLCTENDGYHVVAQWKHMTEEEKNYILT